MSGSEERELTPKQIAFVESLMNGDTIAAAAEAAKVTERSAYRWLAGGPVAIEYARRRGLAIQQGEVLSARAASLAVGVLIQLLSNAAGDVPHMTRLKAAMAILDLNQRTADRDALLSRLERLEGLLSQ